MKRVFLFGLAIVMVAVMSSVWNRVSAQTHLRMSDEVVRATDGAYRDGLFLGGLDARSGRVHRVCAGRWSAAADRASFASGYEAGFGQAVAHDMTARN